MRSRIKKASEPIRRVGPPPGEVDPELLLKQKVAVEEVSRDLVINLRRRYLRAADYTAPVNHDKIKAALSNWHKALRAHGELVIIRDISRVSHTVGFQDFHCLREADSTSTANKNYRAASATQKALSSYNVFQTKAFVVSGAIASRLNAQIYNQSGTGAMYVLADRAAVTIGAAATADKQLYDRHLPLLEAFEAGCMFVWRAGCQMIYMERPYVLKLNGSGQLHCENGPAIVYGDGIQYHYWKGSHVRKDVITIPREQITSSQILTEVNAECRRVLLERMGEAEFIQSIGIPPVDHDDKYGTLYVFNWDLDSSRRTANWQLGSFMTRVAADLRMRGMTGMRPIALLRVVNRSPEPDGSYRIYWLPINPDLYHGQAGQYAHAASASTWRTTPGGKELFFKNWQDYNPVQET